MNLALLLLWQVWLKKDRGGCRSTNGDPRAPADGMRTFRKPRKVRQPQLSGVGRKNQRWASPLFPVLAKHCSTIEETFWILRSPTADRRSYSGFHSRK